MNIQIDRSKNIKKALQYNFSKCDMTLKDLKNQDLKKKLKSNLMSANYQNKIWRYCWITIYLRT